MKRFLLLTLLMAVVMALLLVAGECYVRSFPNQYKYKHHWMLRHADSVEVLILGSSHPYYGIDPSRLPRRAFNLAFSSQNLEYDRILLKHYADRYKRLKTVILDISFFTLFEGDFEDAEGWWNSINYKIYMDVDKHSDFSRYNFELSHRAVYKGKIKSHFTGKKENTMCDSLGLNTYNLLARKKPGWETSYIDFVLKNHTAKNWDALPKNIGYLCDIIRFCQTRSVELVLITTPTWHAYHERLDAKQLNKMYEVIDMLCAEYGLSYHDYLKDKRFTPDDFYDSNHLSCDIGAKKFSDILAKDIWGGK